MIVGICGLAGSGKDTAADFLTRHNPRFVKVAFADPLKRIALDVYKFSDEQLWGPSENRNKPDERYPRPNHVWKKLEVGGWSCLCCGCSIGLNEKFEVPNGPQCFLTPRYALQQLGSEWGRDCFPDTWVKYALDVHERLQTESYMYHFRRGLSSVTFVDNGRPEDPPRKSLKRDVVISDVRFLNEVQAIVAAGGRVYRVLRGQGLGGAAGQHRSELEMNQIPMSLFTEVIDNRKWTLQHFEQYIINLIFELKR